MASLNVVYFPKSAFSLLLRRSAVNFASIWFGIQRNTYIRNGFIYCSLKCLLIYPIVHSLKLIKGITILETIEYYFDGDTCSCNDRCPVHDVRCGRNVFHLIGPRDPCDLSRGGMGLPFFGAGRDGWAPLPLD